jgi:hypothetical protein
MRSPRHRARSRQEGAPTTFRPSTSPGRAGRGLLTENFRAGDLIVFDMYTAHGSLDNRSPENRVRLSFDIRYQPVHEPRDPRFFGESPGGTTGAGYAELNGARPLVEEWHVR